MALYVARTFLSDINRSDRTVDNVKEQFVNAKIANPGKRIKFTIKAINFQYLIPNFEIIYNVKYLIL